LNNAGLFGESYLCFDRAAKDVMGGYEMLVLLKIKNHTLSKKSWLIFALALVVCILAATEPAQAALPHFWWLDAHCERTGGVPASFGYWWHCYR